MLPGLDVEGDHSLTVHTVSVHSHLLPQSERNMLHVRNVSSGSNRANTGLSSDV